MAAALDAASLSDRHAELRRAVRCLQARCLFDSARWAAELLAGEQQSTC